jgi:CheY-like chemotaxis protein
VNFLILVVDDEPDVEALFRQQFRRELRGLLRDGICAIGPDGA